MVGVATAVPSAIVGAAVSIISVSFAAKLVTGTKFDIAFDAESAIVPDIEDTVRSEDVSPAWTV